jgi:hypothetical protein
LAETWYTGVADELARCLTDARNCAEACEALLVGLQSSGDDELRRRVLDAVVAPAAVARVLIDLIDHPRELVLAAARLCRDAAIDAAATLDGVDAAGAAVAALRSCAGSCAVLVESLSA